MDGSSPSPLAAEDALWSFLWGKRRSRRQAVTLPVRLAREGWSSVGETHDVSLHGAMVRVGRAALGAGDDPEAEGDLSTVGAWLGEGFDLEFASGLRTSARLVRMAWRPGDGRGVYLGCEFLDPLSAVTLAHLGLSRRDCPSEVGAATPPAARMAYVAHPKRTLTLHVHEGERVVLSGPVVGAQDAAVAVHLTDVDPTAVVARLGGRANPVRVEVPGDGTWRSRAYLVAVRLLEARADAVEVVLSASPVPSRALKRSLRRRLAPGRGDATPA